MHTQFLQRWKSDDAHSPLCEKARERVYIGIQVNEIEWERLL
jgi:hypothetical protein